MTAKRCPVARPGIVYLGLATRVLMSQAKMKEEIMTTQHTQRPYVPQAPPQRKSKFPTWAIVLLSVFGGILLLCGALTAVSFAVSDVEPEREAQGDTEVVPEPEPVEHEGAALDIEVVETYTEENSLGDVYTAVRVEAYNLSDESVYVGYLDWHVVDADGFKHESVVGPFSTREDRLPGLYLEQDEATTGVFYLEGEVDVATVVYQRWSHDDPIEVEVQ